MHDFERLNVYQDAMVIAVDCLTFVGTLPPSHRFGLASQLQRSSVSVPSNIAEGAGRGDRADFARFVRIALGSLCEVDCQLDLCVRAGVGKASDAFELRDQVNALRRKLYAFEQSLHT